MNIPVDTEAAPVTIKKLPLAVLKVHPDVQREFDPKWAEELIRDWDDRLAGSLVVMPHEDDYWVIDGQHRLAAMRDPEVGKREARCEIHYTVHTLAEAAALQLGVGNAKLWKPIGRFKLRIQKGEPVAAAISAILNKYGTRIHHLPRYGYSCVKQLEVVYGWSPHALSLTIGTIEAAWGSTIPQGRQANVVTALGHFWYQFPNADVDRLVFRLQKIHLPHTLRTAKDAAIGRGKGTPAELASVFHEQYNVGMRAGRLPELNKSEIRIGYRNPRKRA